MSVSNLPLQLNFAQIQADLMMAKRAMEESIWNVHKPHNPADIL